MQIAAEFDNIDSVKHAMEVNSAVAFLPEPTVREEVAAGHLVVLKSPWLKLTRPLGLIQRRNSTLGRTARGVIELILENAKNDSLAALPAPQSIAQFNGTSTSRTA